MGDPRRLKKTYETPAHPWQKERLAFEIGLLEEYGLKNKREIWKAKAKLAVIRRQAKKLIYSSEEEQKVFLEKLRKNGFEINNPIEVLALAEEDILKRRLQSIVFQKNISTTSKGARQLITHKHIAIGGKIINIPSYMVKKDEETNIKLVSGKKSPKAKEQISLEPKPAVYEKAIETKV